MTGSFPFHILQTHTHTHIHRVVGDYRMASCIGSMPMYLRWSKHFVAVWIQPAFPLSFFIFFPFLFFFNSKERIPNGNLRLTHFYVFCSPFSLSHSSHLSFYHGPAFISISFPVLLTRPLHDFTVTCSVENCPKFPLNKLCYLIVPTISSPSTPQSNSLWISCLSVVSECVCARVYLYAHHFVHVRF